MHQAFVGRDAELRLALEALEAGGPVLLEGPAGIGKTTLWRGLIDEGVGRGWRVLSCAPTEAEAALSYAALADWLASQEAGDVTGRVIEIEGGQICLEQGSSHGPKVDLGRRWESAEVGGAVRDLIAQAAAPEPVYGTA